MLSYLFTDLCRIFFGFCLSPIDIHADASAGVSADKRVSERENRQENDKRLFS